MIRTSLSLNVALASSVVTFIVMLLFLVLIVSVGRMKYYRDIFSISELRFIELLSLFCFIYAIGEVLNILIVDPRISVYITRFELVAALYAMYFLLRLIYIYSAKKEKRTLLPKIYLITIIILTPVLLFTGLLVESAQLLFDNYLDITMGMLFYFFYSPLVFAVIIYGFIKFIKSKKNFSQTKKELTRYKLVVIGISTAMFFGIVEVIKVLDIIKINIEDTFVIGISLMSFFIGFSAIYKYYMIQTDIWEKEKNLKESVFKLSEIFAQHRQAIEKYFDVVNDFRNVTENFFRVVEANKLSIDKSISYSNEKMSSIKNFSTMVISNITTFEDILSSIETQKEKINNFLEIVKETNRILSDIEDKGKVVSGGVVNLNSIINDAKNAADVNYNYINTISDSIEDMLNVNNSIKDISEESNILAMNAAIESANSGDFGIGFKVVSEDLRKLSVLTVQETEKIENNLDMLKNDLITGTKSAVSVRSFFLELDSTVDAIFNFVVLIVNQTGELIECNNASEERINLLLDIAAESANYGGEQQELNNLLNESIISVKHTIEGMRRVIEKEKEIVDLTLEFAQSIFNKAESNREFSDELKLVFEKIDKIINQKNRLIDKNIDLETQMTLKS